MNTQLSKIEKWILCILGVLSIIILFSANSLSESKLVSKTDFICLMFLGLTSVPVTYCCMILASYIRDVKKYRQKKKQYAQIEVKKEKALPIYNRNLIVSSIILVALLVFLIVLEWILFEPYFIGYKYGWTGVYTIYISYFTLVILIFFAQLIAFSPHKMLYLCKDNKKVLRYFDKIEDLKKITDNSIAEAYTREKSTLNISTDLKEIADFILAMNSEFVKTSTNLKNLYLIKKMHDYLKGDVWVKRYPYENSECVTLRSGVELWSYYAKEINLTRRNSLSINRSYIFAITPYESESIFELVLTNNDYKYLGINDTYFSKYSNLPPFILHRQNNETTSQYIESVCSEFFAKIRSKYVLIIENGMIGLGLKNATFGIINRIFNKQKTKALTEEAMQEIEKFLLEVKLRVEKW